MTFSLVFSSLIVTLKAKCHYYYESVGVHLNQPATEYSSGKGYLEPDKLTPAYSSDFLKFYIPYTRLNSPLFIHLGTGMGLH